MVKLWVRFRGEGWRFCKWRGPVVSQEEVSDASARAGLYLLRDKSATGVSSMEVIGELHESGFSGMVGKASLGWV